MALNGDVKRNRQEKTEIRRVVRQLHSAVTSNDSATVLNLTKNPEVVDFHYNTVTALQLAVKNNHHDICKILIDRGADVDQVNIDGESLLNLAAWRGYENVVRVLLAAQADPEVSNNRSSTPLNTASYKGHTEVCSLLVKNGASLNRPNVWGQSPLINAACQGNVDIAKILLKANCDVNWTDNERRSALVISAQQENVALVQSLISAGCDLNQPDKYGGTALYFAAAAGYKEIVKLLAEAGADVNKPDTKGFTPFLQAVTNRHLETAQLLISAGCSVNLCEVERNETALHVAVKMVAQMYGQRDSHVSLFHMLMDADCDVNVKDKQGWTPLYQAARGGELEMVRRLLDHDADVSLRTGTGDSVLHGSVYGNEPEVTRLLIESGCDVNSVNDKNELPLFTAVDHRANNTNLESDVIQEKHSIIELLLKAGSKTDVRECKNKMSALFVAVQHEYVEAVDMLIAAGCDVNLPNAEGDTPLWVACSKGCEDIVRILLRHPDIKIDEGITHVPLNAAAVIGSCAVARLLIEAGCDVNKLTNMGISSLYLAAEMNHFPVAQVLVWYGASPSAAHSFRGRCCVSHRDPHPHLELEPLFSAVQNDNLMMIKLILAASPSMPYRALINLRDIVFRTGYAQEARLSERLIVQYAQFFSFILKQPRSLKEECRGRIREALGNRPDLKINDLPLPDRLKDYILLRNEAIMKDLINV